MRSGRARAFASAVVAGLLAAAFAPHTVVGADIAEGAARVFTSFQLQDGCTRFLVLDRALGNCQAGRTLQRLFEIEAYRTLALLALPIARRQAPRIVQIEGALAHLTDGIAQGGGDPSGFVGEVLAGVWAREQDLSQPDLIQKIAEAAGFDGAALIAAAAAP